MFRQGSITGVIGNRDTTWNKGKGVYVIVQLYTHLLYQRAFEIAILELEELADFSLLLPSSNKLIMIDENDEMIGVIQNLYH